MSIGTNRFFTLTIEGHIHTHNTHVVQIHICSNGFTTTAAAGAAVLKQVPFLRSTAPFRLISSN